MGRSIGVVVLCLVVGAGAMYGVSHFRLRVESVDEGAAVPQAKPAAEPVATVRYGEPERLPDRITRGGRAADVAIRPASVTVEAEPDAAVAGNAADAVTAPASAAARAEADAIRKNPLIVTAVLDGDKDDCLKWPLESLAQPVPLSSINLRLQFRFTVAGVNPAQLTVRLKEKDQIAATGTVASDLITFSIPGNGSGEAVYDVEVLRQNTKDNNTLVPVPIQIDGGVPVARFQVRPPAVSGPKVVAASNGRYVASGAISNPHPVYGNYLRVTVKPVGGASPPEFLVFGKEKTAGRTLLGTVSGTAGQPKDGATEYTLELPGGTNAEKILVRETLRTGGPHAYASITITANTAPKLPAPALASTEGIVGLAKADKTQPTPTLRDGFYLLGTNVLNLKMQTSGSGTGQGKLGVEKESVKVLLFVDKDPAAGDVTPDRIEELPDTGTIPFNKIELPTDGEHTLWVLLAVGKEVTRSPKPVFVRVRRGGLVVTRVGPTDLSQATDSTIRVTFPADNPLKPDVALKKTTYTLLRDGKGDNYLSDSPGFDPSTNTVALQVGKLPLEAGNYTLKIFAKDVKAEGTVGEQTALVDLYGNPMGGTFGEDGKEFTAAIAMPIGGLQPSVAAGVTLQTGPYVPYQEYTKFRQVPEGFNPSDRVETRVVRLYYNRDAHRVAQIVNRDVKSFNAAAVDVRRRAADRARDDADRATDERKRLEREAVRLSTEARQAEHDLQAAQQKEIESRGRAAQANVRVSQIQSDLLVAQRELERGIAAAGPRNQADESLTPLRLQVATLTEQLALNQKARDDAAAVATADEQATQQRLTEARNRVRAAETSQADAARALGALPPQEQINFNRKEFRDLEAANLALARENANVQRLNDQLLSVRREASTARSSATTLEIQLDQAKRNLARAEEELKVTNKPELLAESQRQQVRELDRQLTGFRQVISASDATEGALQKAVTEARQRVAAARADEARATEAWQAQEQRELRSKQDQFRREVAAAREDPDTYAPGKPYSDDPVQQCSISVVGEGLIHLRGPIKGLNVIRTMINLLDAPVGQVKVGIHSVQVNGEHGDRMEKVVANIQRYIDHSRFLTAQTSQMLRKAITLVASRKAEEAHAQLGPTCTQAERDQKYVYAFYGKDFIEELRELDSEFLKTGNKLLSLNSMDSTSLASALFQMALAKNTVRAEIVREFQMMLQTQLPVAEQQYFLAGLSGGKCEACCDKKHYVMAYNARFQSFLGFFNAEVQGDDTLNPLQREYIRLAQIFKSRLVTELQLKQRVMERALLEERVGNYLEELRKAKMRDDEARQKLIEVQGSLQDAIAKASVAFQLIEGEVSRVENGLNTSEEIVNVVLAALSDTSVIRPREGNAEPQALPPKERVFWGQRVQLPGPETKEQGGGISGITVRLDLKKPENAKYLWILDTFSRLREFLSQFVYLSDANRTEFEAIDKILQVAIRSKLIYPAALQQLQTRLPKILDVIRRDAAAARGEVRAILNELRQPQPNLAQVLDKYTAFRNEFMSKLRDQKAVRLAAAFQFEQRINPAFDALHNSNTVYLAAARKAELARRPLDEKKLLDMLVDEMEDKYIEQLEGTRAHTANIDNYLKSLSTSLEDDFNTQFYNPAFRKIREASRYWDVTMGQVETTTVLANNRAFAKVDPAATFEFDLPKRNIMITEGFQAAKALMDEYGALLNDPTFLALSKLYSGQPLTSKSGTGGGLSPVLNVLPGLPSSADEMLMAQGGPGRKEFGSALEALIPDPAIYKFETGTGYEIRPVLSPDGQAVVFNFNYMYTTDVREPVRAGEKHLGRVKRHFVHTDVQLSNYELREVSTYRVGLKAARTAKGVPLLQDIPGVGLLFRPLPSAESALQENLIYAQGTIFPTLFDLMGLRYAPAVADLDPLTLRNEEWVVRARRWDLEQRIYDYGAAEVDKALRIPTWEQRADLYRPQVTIPYVHPNGYYGQGLKLKDSYLREGSIDPYDVRRAFPETRFAPGNSTQTAPPVDPYLGAPRIVPGPPPGGYLPPPSVQTIPGQTIITPAPGVPLPYPQGAPQPAPIIAPRR